MAVYITGDIHGLIDDPHRFEIWNFPEGAELTKDDHLIILGDFGMPFDLLENDRDLQALNDKPWTTLFIDGNHEYFPFLGELEVEQWHGGRVQRYPRHKSIIHLMRGEVYNIDGHSFFCMGGAASLDKAFQARNGTWYKEELPDKSEYANAEKNLDECGWEVDFVLSHTCSNRMLEVAIGRKGRSGASVIMDKLTDYFEDLEDRLDYGRWFFGHFHQDADLDEKHTVLYQRVVDLSDYLRSQ